MEPSLELACLGGARTPHQRRRRPELSGNRVLRRRGLPEVSMRNDPELPFFFGADDGLFGMYHAPASPPRRAVLMCPPLGQELIRTHRLYRQLAQALAAQ